MNNLNFKEKTFLVSLDMTDKCNLHCKYCYKPFQEKTNMEPTVEDVKQIFDKYTPINFQLMGGETTLRWNDILEFLDYACPKMISKESPTESIIIFTNGTTGIDFETIPKEYRNRVAMAFSCDGFEEMNDKNRGKGTYKKVIDSIKRSISAGTFTGVSVVRTISDYLDNLDEFKEFLNFLVHELKVDGVVCNVRSHSNEKEMLPVIREFVRRDTFRILSDVIEPFKQYCNMEVKNREPICALNRVHIHTNGAINPRCSEIKPISGHWTQWSKEDLFKWLDYCESIGYDCRCTDWSKAERFANGLLMKNK